MNKLLRMVGLLAALLGATLPAQAQDDTACDHPFFPLELGTTWTYRIEHGVYAPQTDFELRAADDAMGGVYGERVWHVDSRADGQVTLWVEHRSEAYPLTLGCTADGITVLNDVPGSYLNLGDDFENAFHLRLETGFGVGVQWLGGTAENSGIGGGNDTRQETYGEMYVVSGHPSVQINGEHYLALELTRLSYTFLHGCEYMGDCAHTHVEEMMSAVTTFTFAEDIGLVQVAFQPLQPYEWRHYSQPFTITLVETSLMP